MKPKAMHQYRALNTQDHPRFLSKITKLTARKNAWWAVLKAVNRFKNFQDSEDDTLALVSKQFEHVRKTMSWPAESLAWLLRRWSIIT